MCSVEGASVLPGSCWLPAAKFLLYGYDLSMIERNAGNSLSIYILENSLPSWHLDAWLDEPSKRKGKGRAWAVEYGVSDVGPCLVGRLLSLPLISKSGTISFGVGGGASNRPKEAKLWLCDLCLVAAELVPSQSSATYTLQVKEPHVIAGHGLAFLTLIQSLKVRSEFVFAAFIFTALILN